MATAAREAAFNRRRQCTGSLGPPAPARKSSNDKARQPPPAHTPAESCASSVEQSLPGYPPSACGSLVTSATPETPANEGPRGAVSSGGAFSARGAPPLLPGGARGPPSSTRASSRPSSRPSSQERSARAVVRAARPASRGRTPSPSPGSGGGLPVFGPPSRVGTPSSVTGSWVEQPQDEEELQVRRRSTHSIGSGTPRPSSEASSARPRVPSSVGKTPGTPATASRPSSTPRSERNFIAENRNSAANSRASSSAAGKAGAGERFARDESNVPLYLQRVKRMIANEERLVADRLGLNADNSAPPGHRWLPEEERLAIVDGLEQRRQELEAMYAKLPLSLHSETSRRRAHELEQQFREVEDMIRQFARERILVKL